MQDWWAGAVAGGAGAFVGHPFDTVKVRQQTHAGALTPWAAARLIKAECGYAGFWRGAIWPVASRSAISGIAFITYASALKTMSWSSSPEASWRTKALAGLIAGLASTVVACPVDFIKIRRQLNLAVGGRPTGWWVTALRNSAFFCLYFPLYDLLNLHHVPAAGGWAGVLGWIATFPIDTRKSVTQASDVLARDASRGARASFRGLAATVVRAFPVHWTTFAVYEALRLKS